MKFINIEVWMARRRMISQELISDEHFNSISIEAQNIFVRMLSVSDDCGVVPANIYKLNVLINTPKKILGKIEETLAELVKSGLGYLFFFREERFFTFKPSSFEDYQSYILKKATKSEYLRIPKEEFLEISKNFQELPRNSIHIPKSAVSTVESRKQRVESKKQRVESKEHNEEETVYNLWITTYGKNPTPVENKFGSTLIEKFGYKKAKNILWTLNKNNFHTIAKMENVVNGKGEVILIDEKKNGTSKQITGEGKGAIDLKKYERLAAKEPIV
ncbi:MAG: hypothetical protein A2W11_03750 [Ignavibacteria bacterium RBG_16_35_7]|nr:MAG: hypothetical protein A2W11_03750 [Ignavibacteria bacterium RBG_16_35_7]